MTAWEKISRVLSPAAGGTCLALLLWAGAFDSVRAQEPAPDRGQASVFVYHRFEEPRYASTSIGIGQFEAHVAELSSGRYQVMPLEAIIDALAAGEKLPEYTVAISIDDGFASVYTHAWPRLRAANLPFTLFIATDSIDNNTGANLSWDQLREMLAAGGVSIGNHTAAHPHMPRKTEAQVSADINKATARFKKELGLEPALFSYPYGEFSKRDRNQIAALGFKAAFSQFSGVVHSGAERFSLPRFSMNMPYGDLERFKMLANALPLHVMDLTPDEPVLAPDNNPPAFGFTVQGSLEGLEQLACYSNNLKARLPLERLGDNRIEVRMNTPFPPGFGRINCTVRDAPTGRWRWMGQAFVIPRQ